MAWWCLIGRKDGIVVRLTCLCECLQVNVRGVVLLVGDSPKGQQDRPAAYIISTTLGGGRSKRVNLLSRRFSNQVITETSLVGAEDGGGSSETCATRHFQELLVFHGRYIEKWIRALDELEASRNGGDSMDTASAFGTNSLTGMNDMEALSYANQLLLGSQKVLQFFSDNEAERRAQVRPIAATTMTP